MADSPINYARRLIGRWRTDAVVVALGIALLALAREFLDQPTAGWRAETAVHLLIPGLLLIVGVFAGRLAEWLRLPRLTGYLFIGALCGPNLLNLVAHEHIDAIRPVKHLAVGVIALMAGAEIRTNWLRGQARTILSIAASMTAIVPLVMTVSGLWPSLPLGFRDRAVVEGLPALGAVLVAAFLALSVSPMVTISVLKETRSSGPLAQTAIGTVLVIDVVVLLCLSLVLAFLLSLSGRTDDVSWPQVLAATASRQIGLILLSIAIGVGIGYLLRLYTEHGDRNLGWIVVGLAATLTLLESLIRVEPLFCLLAAGFACENLFGRRSAIASHRLDRALDGVSLPVFVVFFVVAGLSLDVTRDTLGRIWQAVLWFVVLRAAAIWVAALCGSWLGRAELVVRRHGWSALISQAGVSIVLATIVKDQFPTWGGDLFNIVIAAIAIHELVGPVLFSWALRRAGETHLGHDSRPTLGPTPEQR